MMSCTARTVARLHAVPVPDTLQRRKPLVWAKIDRWMELPLGEFTDASKTKRLVIADSYHSVSDIFLKLKFCMYCSYIVHSTLHTLHYMVHVHCITVAIHVHVHSFACILHVLRATVNYAVKVVKG